MRSRFKTLPNKSGIHHLLRRAVNECTLVTIPGAEDFVFPGVVPRYRVGQDLLHVLVDCDWTTELDFLGQFALQPLGVWPWCWGNTVKLQGLASCEKEMKD